MGEPRFETVIEVRNSDLDSFGHVNNAVFLNYLEHARFHTLRDAGFSWGVLAENDWAIFVARIEVDYLAEVRSGETLLVRTWVDSIRRTTMKMAQEIVRAGSPGEVVTEALVTAVWIGPNRKPMRVPEDVRARLLGETAGD